MQRAFKTFVQNEWKCPSSASNDIALKQDMNLEESNGQQIIWKSAIIGRLLSDLEKMAKADLPLLIHGESGTGKELIAERIHLLSKRSSGPLLRVNCAAIPHELIESELFGFLKGSFTDAVRNKKGYFESANGGSIYLDEVSELNMRAQAKLLRVLQSGDIQPLGYEKNIKVDVRVIASTNKNLLDAVQCNEFRQDLYYRLAVLLVEIPPLRYRPEDIELLAKHFLQDSCNQVSNAPSAFSIEAIADLLAYRWPGNVRELQNVIRRAIIKSAGKSMITPDALGIRGNNDPMWPGKLMRDSIMLFKKNLLEQALKDCGGNRTWASKSLGIQRTYLSRLIKELSINTKEENNNHEAV